jgi:hypothetical protein
MGDLQRCRTRNSIRISNHSEAMVLGGDQDLIAPQITHRVIAASVAVGELGSRAAIGQSDQLMAEADTECRKPGIGKLADGGQCIPHGGGIAGSVGKEEAIRL